MKKEFRRTWGIDPDAYTDVTHRQQERLLLPGKTVPLVYFQRKNLVQTLELDNGLSVVDDYPAKGLSSAFAAWTTLGVLQQGLGGFATSLWFPMIGYETPEHPESFFTEEFYARLDNNDFLLPGESSARSLHPRSGFFSRARSTMTGSFLHPELAERYLRR